MHVENSLGEMIGPMAACNGISFVLPVLFQKKASKVAVFTFGVRQPMEEQTSYLYCEPPSAFSAKFNS